MTPLKAEYIGADQLPSFVFRLQLCGGPYIPISGASSTGHGRPAMRWLADQDAAQPASGYPAPHTVKGQFTGPKGPLLWQCRHQNKKLYKPN